MRRFFYFTFILVVPILFIMALLSVAPSAADTNAVLTVNSTADSGPGTLREALMTAVNGDTIDFDTAVFPPGSPASIVLSSVLPEIITDNLTITASAAGVILDGSGIGVTPEPLLLDDVSLTLDGGPNELNNGDFGSTLDHWRPWDNNPGATRSLNGSDFHSSPNSYEWDTVATAGSTRTVYDTDPRSDPHSQWPYDVGNTAWISATGGSLVELDFWFKYGGVGVSLRALHSDGWEEHFAGWYFDWESSWVSRTISATLPGGIVAVALEFDHNHSQLQSNGLNINASGVVVQGLQIVNFPGHGVSLYGSAQNNLIGGDRNIGSGPMGQGNLISGNGFGDQHSSCGVYIGDPGTGFNTVQGNYIGVDLSGANPWGNGGMGVELWFATHDNLIIDNVISGNGGHGVNMLNDDVGNTIEDNLIGVDANGQYEIGNSWGGIFLGNGSWDDMAPSQTQILSNVVSGNYGNGIKIEDSTAVSNTIQNNIIGADATGTIPIPNDGDGVSLRNGANNTLVGGSLPGEGNIIFANQSSGVSISDYSTMSNTVEGNQIGFGLGAVRQAFPYDAAISPAYAADCTLYAATVNDGIFKTADCGNTWTDLNVGLTESSLTQVKIPP
ncbi:MAG: right-handed parallel beta-helix repeat-containing protein, partial [Chloroflexi bacterium]|nr:right-handed parallel beta-helix repeat-containing protein [Chloroflexota bacterium]